MAVVFVTGSGTGVGKTFLASALAHAAIRAGHRVLSIRSDSLLKTMHQSRADHTTPMPPRPMILFSVNRSNAFMPGTKPRKVISCCEEFGSNDTNDDINPTISALESKKAER